jgi:ribosome-associated protein
MQGKENAFWVIIDYGNIVVHIFQTEYRQFYRLEDLWADAEKTTYQD